MSLRKFIGFIHPRIAVVLHDLAMAALAWWIAKLLRYALKPDELVSFHMLEIPIVLLVQGLIFRWTGLYRSVWRFASLPDLWNILRAAVFGAAAIYAALFLYDRLDGVPRSVLLLYPMLLAMLLGSPRLIYRYWKDSRNDLLQNQTVKRVLIVGADRAGEVLSRDLHHDSRYEVVGFVDDKASLRGASINGHPVLGRFDQLSEVAREAAVDMLLIALPGASTVEMRRVVSLCDETDLPYRTVPRLEDVVAGRAQFNEIKEVAIEDLLGRDAVELDWTAIRETLSARRVLVTGGGGSIGSELCRQVARLGAQSLTVVEQSEYNLYRITQELRADFPELILDGILANCGDHPAMQKAFANAQPQVVFHAAAYKHVPMLQGQLRAAFGNNVLGTRTVADAARAFGVECFVLISTDKAVNPTSVMGACKRVAEIYCQNLDAHAVTRFMTVRFGNVLDSAGSVVPLFREQIRVGGPVTVTHPEISRYFMTIPEACQLILQTASIGKGGEIFALDMGEPVKIRDLAEQMIRLAGKKPGSEIPIVYTGLRAGEKLFEELFHPLENYSATEHAKIFLAQHREVSWELLKALLNKAAEAVTVFDEEELRRCVSSLLPSFRWSESAQPDNVVSIRRANPRSVSEQALRKVVFPVAGLGTRFPPATKVVAKEMLPVLDKPLIQYAVDEAVDAGADTLIFVTNRYKHAIADYFDKAYELEAKLQEKGKDELLALVQGTLPRHVRAIFVTQPEALGLGHAVLCAKPVVGDEPFGVVLPDDLIWNGAIGSGKGALRQMAELADAQQAGVIAVEEVPHNETDKYGIVDAKPVDERSALIRHMVEKPKPADAPSNLAVVGRYVLPGRIFQLLEQTTPGAGGEIQLTDAIEALLKEQGKVLAYRFEGTRFDCGNKAGLVRATMHMAMQDPKLAPTVRAFLGQL